MNDEKSVSCAPKQDQIIPQKIQQFNAQNKELNGSIGEDISMILNRISSIGKRLNTLNHPDTIPQPVNGADSMNKSIPDNPKASGLITDIENCLEDQQAFINKWHSTIYPAFNNYLRHLEEHI